MNKIFKLATGHFLLIPSDAPHEILPIDMNMYGETAVSHVKVLRDLADAIESADRRLTESRKS